MSIFSKLLAKPPEGKEVEADTEIPYGGTGQPLEENPSLDYRMRYATFRRMRRRVPVIAAFHNQLKLALEQVTFSFEPSRSETRARALLGPLLSPGALSAISSSVPIGASVVNFGLNEQGNIAKWVLIPQETIERYSVNADGDINGFIQRTTSGRHFIPRVFTVFTKSGSGPRGEGLYLDAADPALRYIRAADAVELAEASNLLNKPNIFLDPERTRKKLGRNLRSLLMQKRFNPSNRWLLPSDIYEGESDTGSNIFAQSAKKAIVDYPPGVDVPKADSRDKLSYQISLILGTEFSLLGMNREGSRALAETQKNTFDSIVRSSMKVCEHALQELLNTLYNLYGYSAVPLIKLDTEPLPSVDQQLKALIELQQAGLTLDSPQAQYILQEVSLPTTVPQQTTGENDGSNANPTERE